MIFRLEERWAFPGKAVFLKEVRSELVGRAWYQKLCFWGALGLLGLFILLGLKDGQPEETGAPAGCVALVLVLLVVPATAASSMTREIEEESHDLLRGSLLTRREVYAGKLLAAIYAGAGVWAAAACTLWVQSWGFWLAALLVLGASLLAIAALSLFVSVLCRKTTTALVATYLGLLALVIALPLALSLLPQKLLDPDSALFRSLSPFMTMEVLGEEPEPHGVLPLFLAHSAAATLVLSFLSLTFLRLRERDR